jgi:quinol monooxygenase YgiN
MPEIASYAHWPQSSTFRIDSWQPGTYDTQRSPCSRYPRTSSLVQRGANEEATIDVQGATMIFIAVKFSIRPEVAEQWLARVAPFTAATRAEPGNIFFEWSRSVERPNQFVLLEAFRNREAGEAHVHSEHFRTAMAWMPDAIAATPEIIHVEAPGESWSTMAELQPRTAP